MPETRRHQEDKLVVREATSHGMRLGWEDHLTGDTYGGTFSREEGIELMSREGLDPDLFHPVLPKEHF